MRSTPIIPASVRAPKGIGSPRSVRHAGRCRALTGIFLPNPGRAAHPGQVRRKLGPPVPGWMRLAPVEPTFIQSANPIRNTPNVQPAAEPNRRGGLHEDSVTTETPAFRAAQRSVVPVHRDPRAHARARPLPGARRAGLRASQRLSGNSFPFARPVRGSRHPRPSRALVRPSLRNTR